MRCLNDIRFVIKVFASGIAQQPLKHLFDWMQSKTGDVNPEKIKNARQPYLGETVLSELATWKCESIRSEFDMLIQDKAQGDNDGWGKVWRLVPQELVTDTRALMLTLVCSAVSQFDMRIESRVFAHPALLFVLAQKKPNEVCERRAEVARGLLAKEACCIQNEKDHLTEKIVRWYRPELVIVAKSGLCPRRLFVTFALVRSLWMCDTQNFKVPPQLNAMEGTGSEARERRPQEEGKGKKGKVARAIKFKGLKLHSLHRFIVLLCLLLAVRMQGANSVLQRICSAAPSIRKPLASARLSIKCGEVPRVGVCVTLHKAVIAEIEEGKLASRFGALQDDQDDPPEAEPPQPHSVSTASIATTLRELRKGFRLVVLVA